MKNLRKAIFLAVISLTTNAYAVEHMQVIEENDIVRSRIDIKYKTRKNGKLIDQAQKAKDERALRSDDPLGTPTWGQAQAKKAGYNGNVIIIHALMGAGKSTYILQYLEKLQAEGNLNEVSVIRASLVGENGKISAEIEPRQAFATIIANLALDPRKTKDVILKELKKACNGRKNVIIDEGMFMNLNMIKALGAVITNNPGTMFFIYTLKNGVHRGEFAGYQNLRKVLNPYEIELPRAPKCEFAGCDEKASCLALVVTARKNGKMLRVIKVPSKEILTDRKSKDDPKCHSVCLKHSQAGLEWLSTKFKKIRRLQAG